ncbi:hypothetical protein B0T25DRAFT_124122 [Lasiosphaeria hispida]|uniref:Uncharacterized protein n=1 Tax=Lasiosphaeria hispida TaxID=260671 RepID=A0AAJ0HS33_9PEZI|nr:hypothetical protein B0T25DRAFT_124122 [Lasiosphaeria hispida]
MHAKTARLLNVKDWIFWRSAARSSLRHAPQTRSASPRGSVCCRPILCVPLHSLKRAHTYLKVEVLRPKSFISQEIRCIVINLNIVSSQPKTNLSLILFFFFFFFFGCQPYFPNQISRWQDLEAPMKGTCPEMTTSILHLSPSGVHRQQPIHRWR